MASGLSYAPLFALLAAGLIVGFLYYRRKRSLRIARMLLSRWGEIPERRLTPNELASIRVQAEALAGGGFAVDDITWNDLDMDRLYARMNATLTDAGDQALYGMLRNPVDAPEELGRRRAVMLWAKGDPAGRERMKRILYGLGRTGDIDLQILLNGERLAGKRWAGYAAMSLSLAAGIVLCVAGLWPALFPTLALAIANVVVSLRSRAIIGKYFSLYEFIPAVLAAAGRAAKAGVPALAEFNARISEPLGRIKGILSNMLLNYYYSFNNQYPSNPVDMILSALKYFFLVDLISLYNLSRSVTRYRREILDVYRALGEADALIAAASWRETLGVWCEPELAAGEGGLSFEAMAHPLLDDPVANSLDIRRNVLLTGSNATGKSTFLKAVAINAILAQSLFTCAAGAWRGGFFRVYTSMAIKDDLFGGESYFIAEIKSLKRMLDNLGEGVPCLCIVDEVLRGTNTGERIAAASEALVQFSRRNCLCLAATHDIELTYILGGLFENMHFTETVEDGGISFDYRIRPGRASSRNAIKLLELMGYGSELVESAGARLERFERTGRWSLADGPIPARQE